jgi:two-component system sensor histidine kinase PhoQ
VVDQDREEVKDRPEDLSASTSTRSRPFSLSLRLIVMATVVLIIALVAVGMALSTANRQATVSALRERMESYVYLVLAASEVNEIGQLTVDEDIGDPRLTQPGSGIYAHVHDGNAHWNSLSALGLRLPELPILTAGETAFQYPTTGIPFYVFQYGIAWQLSDESVLPLTVDILVDPVAVDEQVVAFRKGLVRSLSAAGFILVLAQMIMITLAFRPLRKVAADVGEIESGRSERLGTDYPSELEPLTRNVNRLLETEQANQQRYRNALDSLAHSLKTPLAVIRAGVRVESEESRSAIDKAAEDMDHLISTRLQRAAASTRRTLARPIEVEPQMERVLSSLKKVYSQKMISVDVNIDPDLKFFGEKRDLLEVMGNLFDNAFKYGEKRVRVSAGVLERDATRPGLWMSVEDDGPGIDRQRWAELVERGVRGDERVEGYGLGLAIVLELVSAYGGEISISKSQLGGASVKVELAPS